MTYAYDKICLDRASDTLGRMLDYSVYSLHYEIPVMMDLFIASGTAALFERGDIKTIAGMSGIELSYAVLERSGITFERTQPRYTKGLSPEYWCGHALARIQWETCLSFAQIMKNMSPSDFISVYGRERMSFLESLPLNINGAERSAQLKAFGLRYTEEAVSRFISTYVRESGGAKAAGIRLKALRIKNGLSQNGLAEAAGIPVRTIQQYEQGQKDLGKARSEYLIALSRTLSCDPAQLLG